MDWENRETLKQCREKDQQKKAVTEIDGVSRLPLSMVMTKIPVTLCHWCVYELMKNKYVSSFLQESCEELRKLAQKIESQLSEIIGSYDEAVVPCYESRGCETKSISKEVFHETPTKTSKHHEQKEREQSQINPRAKKRRVRRLQDIGVLRKSPRLQKLI